jgi:cellulose synthase (UDP-forming)
MNETLHQKTAFLKAHLVAKWFFFLNAILAAAYFAVLVSFPPSNPWLFWLLVTGEVYHVWLAVTFLFTVWKTEPDKKPDFDHSYTPPVDVFITVAGEPLDVIEETINAAKSMEYPNFKVYVLNDGYVAKKDNWKDVIALARKLGVFSITRRKPGGAKAGNINNALSKTGSPYVAIFDADHVPHHDFLFKTMGYFTDPRMGFVQSPQYYKNFNKNLITSAAWDQQALFFGPICKGKNRNNSVTMCGTNMVISRSALREAGGICETNIAEDFLTGLFMHERGWKSVYVPEVLAEGLAPEDLLSYSKQQFRWARGSLEVLFRHNPLFSRNLTWAQKVQYLSSASFFLSGVIVLMNAALPLLFFYFGIVPLQVSTMFLAIVFLPFIFATVYILRTVSNESFSFPALSFAMSNFMVHIKAALVSMLGLNSGFSVTSKKAIKGRFFGLVVPHLSYLMLVVVGVGVAFFREGLTVSLLTNLSWAAFNAAVFIPYINAALRNTDKESAKKKEKKVKIEVLDRSYAD